jgi:leader peptidase (prepilin peptidase)/N-methyltransferase
MTPLDLIPVVSFLLLRGRCRNCGAGISSRYMFVELLTGCLFTICYLKAGLQLYFVKHLFFTAFLVVVAFIDLEHYIVPNKLVLFGLGAGVVFYFISRDISYASALLGITAGSGFLLFLALVSRGGLGGGDIKLAAVTGLFLGWPLAPLSIFLGCCLAGLVGVFLILVKRKKRKDIMPLVPFLAVGSYVTMLWGWDLIRWYLRFLNI